MRAGGPAYHSAFDRTAGSQSLAAAPDQFLSRTLKSAQLVRISGGSDAMIEALRTGQADVYGFNAENVHKVAAGLPGARNKIAGLVSAAKAAGLIQKSIEEARLKGFGLRRSARVLMVSAKLPGYMFTEIMNPIPAEHSDLKPEQLGGTYRVPPSTYE